MRKNKQLKKGVSVIICTYNGANRLGHTFDSLLKQQGDVPWEIIFVDNASTDETMEFSQNWWRVNGNEAIVVSFLSQPKPGKQYAQEMGYAYASYEYLLVCDDDNWLCDTYIQTAFDIMESDNQIGALGGWCDAEFETDKPTWFDSFSANYAVTKQAKSSGDITEKKGALYGAGMVLRKSHWIELETKGFSPLLTCRKGDTLSSGGDTEYCFALRLLGYKIWYDERLYFKHYMTHSRLNFDYLSRLRKAMSESDVMLKGYIDEINNRPLNRSFFYKKIVHMIYRNLWKSIKRLFSKDDLNKERAKSFFREVKLMMLSFKVWHQTRRTIKEWLTKPSSN